MSSHATQAAQHERAEAHLLARETQPPHCPADRGHMGIGARGKVELVLDLTEHALVVHDSDKLHQFHVLLMRHLLIARRLVEPTLPALERADVTSCIESSQDAAHCTLG